MADMGWSKYVRDQEAAHYGACFEAAEKHGLTPGQADECDEGSCGCPECPWREEFEKGKTTR